MTEIFKLWLFLLFIVFKKTHFVKKFLFSPEKKIFACNKLKKITKKNLNGFSKKLKKNSQIFVFTVFCVTFFREQTEQKELKK